MEHGSLADLIREEGPKLPYPRLMTMIDELTQALDAIHDRSTRSCTATSNPRTSSSAASTRSTSS